MAQTGESAKEVGGGGVWDALEIEKQPPRMHTLPNETRFNGYDESDDEREFILRLLPLKV